MLQQPDSSCRSSLLACLDLFHCTNSHARNILPCNNPEHTIQTCLTNIPFAACHPVHDFAAFHPHLFHPPPSFVKPSPSKPCTTPASTLLPDQQRQQPPPQQRAAAPPVHRPALLLATRLAASQQDARSSSSSGVTRSSSRCWSCSVPATTTRLSTGGSMCCLTWRRLASWCHWHCS